MKSAHGDIRTKCGENIKGKVSLEIEGEKKKQNQNLIDLRLCRDMILPFS